MNTAHYGQNFSTLKKMCIVHSGLEKKLIFEDFEGWSETFFLIGHHIFEIVFYF